MPPRASPAADIAWCGVLALAAFALFLIGKTHVVPGIDGPVTFDGQYYLSIFERGYAFDGDIEHKQNTAFLPLTGLLIGAATAIGPGPHSLMDVAVCGVVVLFGTLLGLMRLAEGESPFAGRAAALLWAGSPMALYNFVGYSEPFFALFSVWAFVAIRSGWWWRAVALAAVAMLARPQAAVLAAFVGIAIVHRDHWRPLRLLDGPGAAQVALIPLPLMAFATWLAWRFGDATLYVNSLEAWRRGSFLDGSLRAPGAFLYFLDAVSRESIAVSHWTTLLAGVTLAMITAVLALAAAIHRRESAFFIALVAFLFTTAAFDANNVARHAFFMFPWALLAGIALAKLAGQGCWRNVALVPWLLFAGAINLQAIARFYRGEWVS